MVDSILLFNMTAVTNLGAGYLETCKALQLDNVSLLLGGTHACLALKVVITGNLHIPYDVSSLSEGLLLTVIFSLAVTQMLSVS